MAKERSGRYYRPTAGIETRRLQSALLRSGVSFTGTHQLINGLTLTSQADRAILIGLLSRLLQGGDSNNGLPAGKRPLRPLLQCGPHHTSPLHTQEVTTVGFSFQKIAIQANGKGAWIDDDWKS
jgi:hypothetical protein